jgi:ATP-dependent DNA helicase RecG
LPEQENLWQYYFAIFDRLRSKLDLPFKLTEEGFASEDYPQLEALREALVNLLMHTDHFSAAKPRLRIFTDRIEFYNPGGLPKSLETIMAEDISLPRNEILAKLFRVVKLAENGGYGFDKMIGGWAAYTNTVPEFSPAIDSVKVVFRLDSSPIELEGGQIGDQIGGQIDLTDRQKEVLEVIRKNNKLTRADLAEILNINQSAAQSHFDALKAKGVIRRIGGTRGYWEILAE